MANSVFQAFEYASYNTKNEGKEGKKLPGDLYESLKTFAGENYKIAYIPENAKRVLLRYEKTADHYEFKRELIL